MRHLPLQLVVSALLLTLTACHQYGIPNPNHRPAEVAPVPIDESVDRTGLALRLAKWIDGSHAWEGDRRAGSWMAAYTGGDTVIAELDWDRFYLRAKVKIQDDEVEIEIADSAELDQHSQLIHKRAILHLTTLRRTIRTALRRDPVRAYARAREREERFVRRVRDTPRARGEVPNPMLGRYHALVIGNERYSKLPRLRTPVADARAVSRLLEDDYGFEVELLRNADRKEIVSALNGYRSKLDADDSLLIFYAGHGWFDEAAQRGYWLPVDAARDDPTDWVSNATITDMLRAIPARHVLVVADSCYSGTLTRGVRAKSQNPQLSRLAQKRSRTALTSGGLEPVEDGEGEHSVFATAFVNALRENNRPLDAHSLFVAMQRPVMLDSDQVPQYSDIRRAGHEGGDFLFPPRRTQAGR